MGTRPIFAVPVQTPQPVTVQRVEPQAATTDAGADARDHPEQEAQANASRDIIALRRAVAQGRRPAGPPPSFEVSLLEVESDLKQKLARMEVERAQARDADAVQGQVPDTAPEAAEADGGHGPETPDTPESADRPDTPLTPRPE